MFIHLQPSNIEYASLQKFHQPHINFILGPIIGDFNVQYTIPIDTPDTTPKPHVHRAAAAAHNRTSKKSSQKERDTSSGREGKGDHFTSSSAASSPTPPQKVATAPADLISSQSKSASQHHHHHHHHHHSGSSGGGGGAGDKNNHHLQHNHNNCEGDHRVILAKMKSRMTDEEVYSNLKLLVSDGSPTDKYRKLEKIGQGTNSKRHTPAIRLPLHCPLIAFVPYLSYSLKSSLWFGQLLVFCSRTVVAVVSAQLTALSCYPNPN
ncbi:hypothetical protein ACTXT7_008821, partial [Hymenolepis weldensis]